MYPNDFGDATTFPVTPTMRFDICCLQVKGLNYYWVNCNNFGDHFSFNLAPSSDSKCVIPINRDCNLCLFQYYLMLAC